MSRDSVLVAIDAKSGAEVWATTVQDYRQGYYANLAPLVVEDKIVVGTSGGERGIRGYIAAFNAESGEEAWRTFLVPEPGQPGSETWPQPGDEFEDAWKTGGASSWVTGQYDPENKIIYWGTGNGGPWMERSAPGRQPVRDLGRGSEGRRRRDRRSLPVPPQRLVRLGRSGCPDPRRSDQQGWREGPRPRSCRPRWRAVGARAYPEGPINFIKGTPYVEQNWIKSMDPETGRIEYAEGTKPGTGIEGDFCPSFWGGKDWPPIAYDPNLNYVFIPANENLCTIMAGGTVVEYRPGASFTRGTQGDKSELYMVEGADHVGEVRAWDLNTGKEVWNTTFQSQNWGPLMATAGGLVFGGGTNDSMFRAFDSKSGEILWEQKLNSGVIGVPASFEVDGKQYVSVQAGWGIDAAGMQTRLSASYPDKFKAASTVPTGGVIWVFEVEE